MTILGDNWRKSFCFPIPHVTLNQGHLNLYQNVKEYTIIPSFNHIDSQMPKCMSMLKLFDAVSKTHHFP